MSSPYDEAGKLLHEILTKHVSLKTASFGTNTKRKQVSCSKTAYAQVSNTLLHKSSIDSILNHNHGKLKKLIEWDTIHNKALIYIILYELLFGKYHAIHGGGRLKRMIMQHAPLFQSTRDLIIPPNVNISTHRGADQQQIQQPLASVVQSVTAANTSFRFPRYVRVNTLRASTQEVVVTLKGELQTLHSNHINACIFADPIVPDLLVLSPHCSIDWHHHSLITSGKIVLQDKSSCFSALALVHGRQHSLQMDETMGDFIDACAAPGNKCQHLAALIAQRHEHVQNVKKPGSTSRIFAMDKSLQRMKILKERIESLQVEQQHDGASPTLKQGTVNIIPIHQDFLKVNPSDPTYSHVKSILLDPSCSGSGILNTPDRMIIGENDRSPQRIQALASFQLLALKHAMSFPQVGAIVYSTCSIHEEENEVVVSCALEEMNGVIQDDDMRWVITSPYALRNWGRRGNANIKGITEDQAKACIRVDGSDGDETNGFFVCYLERLYVNRSNSVSSDEETKLTLPNFVDGWYEGQFSPGRGTVDQGIGHHSCVKPLETLFPGVDYESCDKPSATEYQGVHQDPCEKLSNTDKSSRKRQKKQEWKKKQKQQRLERLKSRGA